MAEESLNLAQVNEVAEPKAALEACKDKWYNMGFTDAENSVEPIIYQSQRHGFGEGWVATLQVMGVPDDSPLRNLKQIPYREPPPPPPPQVRILLMLKKKKILPT